MRCARSSLDDYLPQTVDEDIFDALRNIIASRIRKYGHTENDTRDSFLAIDKENTRKMKMDNVASALRDFGARLREEQLYEMFKLLGEDQEDPAKQIFASSKMVWLTQMMR